MILYAVALMTAAQSVRLLVHPSEGLNTNLVLQLALLMAFAFWSVRAMRSYLNPPLLLLTALYFWHSTFLTGHFLVSGTTFEFSGITFSYAAGFLPAPSLDTGEAEDLLVGDLSGGLDPSLILITESVPQTSAQGESLRVLDWNR